MSEENEGGFSGLFTAVEVEAAFVFLETDFILKRKECLSGKL